METRAKILNDLGEPKHLAAELAAMSGRRVSRDSIYKWKTREAGIPQWARPYLRLLVKKAGLDLPDELRFPEDVEEPKGEPAAQATSA